VSTSNPASVRPGTHPLVLIGAAGALAAAIALQVVRDRAYPGDTTQAARFLYLTSPAAIGRLALGFDALAADIYWIRTIQHYGGDRLRTTETGRRRYELLYPLLDITTSLDPNFNIAYRFGAIFLSEPYPGGLGRPDLAVTLLKKGIAARPTKWEYYHDIGFIHYWSLGDYQAAADWFRRGAEQPNAPEWLLPVAASMLAEGTDRASARFIWTELLHAEEDWVRKRAARALVQLQALDQIDELSKKIADATPLQGAYSWPALMRAGVFPGIPTDPTGTPYDINPTTGEITVSRISPLYPMPRGLRRR
jgi:tetratricopeptide (TPR) repeat protein